MKKLLVLLILVLPFFTHAAIYTWDGGGVDNNWSTCANWSSNVCPTSSDVVQFTASSTKDSIVDTTLTVAGLGILTGYTGTVTVQTPSTFTSFSQSAGTFVAHNGTTTFGSTFTSTGGVFNSNGGTVYFPIISGTITFTPGNIEFNNLYISRVGGTGNRGLSVAGDVIVRGDLTISNVIDSFAQSIFSNNISTLRTFRIDGNLNVPSTPFDGQLSIGYFDGTFPTIFEVKGNVNLNDSNSLFYADMLLNGAGVQTVSSPVGTVNGTSVWTVDKPSGSVEILTDMYHGGSLLVATGTLKTNGHNITGLTGMSVGATSEFILHGSETLGATPSLATSSTITYVGTSSSYFIKNWQYKNLNLQGEGSTFTMFGSIVVRQNLNIASGTLDVSASNHALSVAGNWNNTGGFNARAGTVTLNGLNQTITGSSTFYNLTKRTSITDSLTFDAGGQQTIVNTWTATGTPSSILSLKSTNPGTQWLIDPRGSRVLEYVNVQDSKNVSGTTIVFSEYVTNSGNNTNWGETVNIPVAPQPFIGPRYGGGDTPLYGCADKTATNYQEFRAHMQSLCLYGNLAATISTTTPVTTTVSAFIFNTNLKFGIKNLDVKMLQSFLNENGYMVTAVGAGSRGNETMYFGVATKNAVMKFQKAYGLMVDGIAGPVTRKTLNNRK